MLVGRKYELYQGIDYIRIQRALARIAQVVEQRTENPRVGGSSPPPGIVKLQSKVLIAQVIKTLSKLRGKS